MRRSKPLAALAGAALLTLAACGGSGDSGGDSEVKGDFEQAASGFAKDPEAQGPAPEVPGATEGGTLTVYAQGDPGPNSLDPTEGWSVLGNSIQQAYMNRSLTQYMRDPDTGQFLLVPDLATDLGRPNSDFTEWTFTLRDGVKWEDGKPVTPEELAFGIQRSLDSDTFPAGPGTEYSKTYFLDADTYKGPYTDKGVDYQGITVDGNDITIKMSKPFPDMDWWGSFMAMGPAPLGKVSDPPAYGKHPLSTGPYKIESFRSSEELVMVKNDQWDPATDPARHQYADKVVIKFNQDPNKTDQVMLSGNTDAQTGISIGINSANYQKFQDTVGDRLVKQSAQCTNYTTPDYTKITDINIRKAIAYAIPYEDVWTVGGEIPGVTRVPANTLMPPGMAGRKDFYVDGEQITYNPDKAKQLLADAGVTGQYKLTNVYYEPDPLARDTQKVMVEGMKAAGFDLTGIPVEVSPYDIWLNPDDKTNKKLNLRGVNWCSDWPSGLTMLPPIAKTGAAYNTAQFSEKAVDDKMESITTLPLDEQPGAWGDLDEEISTQYFPIIPTAYRNEMLVYGEKVGAFYGDPAFGAPYYKDLFVKQ
ncbi:MAG TPA: ABC transporter substrate-binding protein [Nocardioides sp.]|uniref:ABC transporter substrate-binding protein n=1 Tax=Nocardioides sp. TaxID=35761 RepID=UPI002CA3EED1|nr:ABC transporter substrate-binding protein [Nocardioides sp.]HQR26370.1 ABC transporter substrate-binding protein [Nocardioides sp.]